MTPRTLARKIAATFEALLADLGSDASRRGYRIDWGQFAAWCKGEEIPVLKVTPRDVKRWNAGLAADGKAKRTRERALSVVRRVYGALVADELLDVNPAREVRNTKAGKAGKPVTYLEADQLAKMLAFGGVPADHECPPSRHDCNVCESERNWTDRRDRMCVLLLAGTGRRRSEVARMRFEDFSPDGVTGVVKGGAEKTAPVPDWLRKELAEWGKFSGRECGPVLPLSAESREGVNGDGVYAIVKRVAAAVGLDPEKVAPHDFRRSLATLGKMRGISIDDLRIQLSHASENTTSSYIRGSKKVEVAPAEWMSELLSNKPAPDGR